MFILPSLFLLVRNISIKASNHYKELANLSKFDATQIGSRLFGKDFDSFEDVVEFGAQFETDEEIVSEIADESVFLHDFNVGRSISEQLAELDKDSRMNWHEHDLQRMGLIGPQRILRTIQTRMMQVNEVLLHATEISAHPVIQAPVTFHWLESKLRTNAEIMSKVLEVDIFSQLPLTNGLLTERLQWLANVPVTDLVTLRKQGFLSELREIISTSVGDLSNARLDDFDRIGSTVDVNLNTALNRHQEFLREIHNETLDGLLISVPALLASVVGTILPLFGIITPWTLIAAGAIGTASLKDLIPSLTKLKRERENAERTPVGILWSAREAGSNDRN